MRLMRMMRTMRLCGRYTWRNQIGEPQRRPPKLGGAWYAWDSYGFGMFEVLAMIETMGFGTDRRGSWGVMITRVHSG